jgi:glycosyltransferase involved in cell wall biosynthesis
LKIPVLLASDKTLNEPAPSGPIGLADSLFHAAKARGFAGFVTTGLFGTQYLVSLGCPRDRVTAGLCPVDVSAWQARKVRATEHARAARARMQGAAFIVLAVSALTPEAGVLVLLESFARLLRVQPNSFLICVGEGALRKAVRPRLGELGLEARVSFPGAVNDDELATYYASADVVASVPIFQEWGTRILEGMACGLPVVATTTSSSAGDLVVHGRSGALCQPGDPDSTTQALELVAQRVADRPGALGQFAFDVVQRFDVKLVAERLADLVERVAAESWRPPSVMSTVLSATRNEFGRWSL